jgi:CubicO group peptidase (beta-lactamase class C family)
MQETSVSTVAAVVLLLLTGCATESPDSPHPELNAAFDEYVLGQMEAWRAPGVVVIAARQGGEPLVRYYGTRLPDSIASISGQTSMQIASNTKGITGLTVGLLVSEGVLNWDDPVIEHLPEYSALDTEAAEATTIRDLMSHQAGLPGGLPGGFYRPDRDLSAVIGYLGERELNPALRERFSYSNTGIALAGQIVGRAAGTTWSDFVHSRLFEPLGMTSSYTSVSEFIAETGEPDRTRDMFFPAVKADGVVEPGEIEETYCDEFCGPAGGVWSTPDDLAKYVQLLANDGWYAGKAVIPESVLEEVWTIEVDVDRQSGLFDHPEASVSYARGWASYEHAGRRVFEHGGGWMSSFISVMPEEGFAVGVFTNAYFSERTVFESLYFLSAIKLRAFDTLLEEELTDWSEPYSAELSGGVP